MFDEDLPKPKVTEFPRNLEALSIEDLEHYITQLEGEIERVRGDIKAKKASRDAAASVFKS